MNLICPYCRRMHSVEDSPIIPKRMPFIIIDLVCNYYNTTLKQVCTKSRKPKIVAPRHVAMHLISLYTQLSQKEIGQLFERDRTVVNHARERVRNSYDTKSDLYEVVKLLDQKCKELIEKPETLLKSA